MANILRKQNQMISAGGGCGGSSEEYTDIDYEDWVELTPEEQESGKYYIHGAPWADGDISVELMTKLWENPSPTSSFAAQNITLSSADYDLLLTIYRWSVSSDTNISVIAKKGQSFAMIIPTNSSSTARNYERYATYTDATHYAIDNCSYTGGTTSNNNAIPIAVYGIKTTASVKINAIAESVSTSADKCMLSDGVTSVEDALDGFKFYHTGTSIVGLVSDDSPYTDSNGNYILANSTTGQSMIDNVTYKSIASTEDTRGTVGADSAIPFSRGSEELRRESITFTAYAMSGSSASQVPTYTLTCSTLTNIVGVEDVTALSTPEYRHGLQGCTFNGNTATIKYYVYPNYSYISVKITFVGTTDTPVPDIQLLWTNPAPTSAFAAQTVSLDLSNYKSVCIEYLQNNDSSAPVYPKAFYAVGDTVSVPASSATQQAYPGGSYGRSLASFSAARDLTITTTGIVFGSGYAQNGAGTQYAIPQRIWGIKAQIYPSSI